jgi:UDP-glucose:(heptosyl)LPS alpha-1,3-glucosyltransferase
MSRALIVSRNLSSATGSLAIVLALAGRLRERGWYVDLYGERAASDITTRTGATVHRVRPVPLARGYLERRLFAHGCQRVVRRGAYDLVIGHGDAWDQDVLFLHNLIHLAHELIPGGVGKKVSRIGRFHADILRGQRFRVCIANSGLMARDLANRFAIPPEKIRVAWPGFDPLRFHPAPDSGRRQEVRREVGAAPEDQVVGLITSGDFGKRGLSLLLGATARLDPALRERLRVLVVGKDRTQAYRSRAERLGIGHRVAFLPARERVEDLYRALDLLVHPAHIEEFGLVVLEAMACGVPVLTSRRVGASELLDDDFMVMPAPDETELAARMERLLTQPDLRRECAARALEAAAGHTWERYLDEVCAVLEDRGWSCAG